MDSRVIFYCCLEILIQVCLLTRDAYLTCASAEGQNVNVTQSEVNENAAYAELLTFYWQPEKVLLMSSQSSESAVFGFVSIAALVLLVWALISKCFAWPWYLRISAEIAVGVYFTVVAFSALYGASSIIPFLLCSVFVYKMLITFFIWKELNKFKRQKKQNVSEDDNTEAKDEISI
ncbi:uncharacterized protein LOC132199354 isoform X2 [Neocloeon triangulifer]|uniref:uncharacterized protein LOC132199354 isoform X2 n=1 Tax=Neocloeon triangulifer TaxID=2078957 RepID=UPI00286F435D|nr:uncharacterized protein LOC132199354 isoform X2 [Neocloeon triangulifer]